MVASGDGSQSFVGQVPRGVSVAAVVGLGVAELMLFAFPAFRLAMGDISGSVAVAMFCAGGGLALVMLGGFLAIRNGAFKQAVTSSIEEGNRNIQELRGKGTSETSLKGLDDYIKSLAELAKALGAVSEAVAAFVVSAVLFLAAGAIVTTETLL